MENAMLPGKTQMYQPCNPGFWAELLPGDRNNAASSIFTEISYKGTLYFVAL